MAYLRWLLRISLAICLAGVTGLTPSVAFAYVDGFYNSTRGHPQWTDYYCVPASAEAELDYVYSRSADSTSQTQYEYYGYGRSHDLIDYGSTAGVDPRGWAYILWDHSPSGYSYNDYLYSSTNQDNADYALAWSIHATQQAAGVVVWKGWHAITAVGYQASDTLPNGGTLRGFYLWDPWNGAGFQSDTWGTGISPNAYYTLAWFNGRDSHNRLIFSQNIEKPTPGEAYWVGSYVLILRSTGGHPTNNPPDPYGVPSQYLPSSAGASPPETTSASPTVEQTPLAALVAGLTGDGLVDDNEFGLNLSNVSIGRVVSVSSAATGIPSYSLAEVVTGGKVVAIAILDGVGSGFRFGALAPVTTSAGLPSTAAVLSAAASLGASATSASAVWAPSESSPNPFYPLWRLSDGHSQSFLTPDGTLVGAVPAYPGYGPATN